MLSIALLAAGAQPTKNQLVLGKLAALEGELKMLKPTEMERKGPTRACMRCVMQCYSDMEDELDEFIERTDETTEKCKASEECAEWCGVAPS